MGQWTREAKAVAGSLVFQMSKFDSIMYAPSLLPHRAVDARSLALTPLLCWLMAVFLD